ncbi:MAG: peptidoglycan-binding protein [Oculatellaceae cyanobacterium Prado106]|nr:peptidoglycan-binding protein [Oculatellaceae cyanobacterium Prado106]
MQAKVQRITLARGATGAAVTELQNLLRQRINFDLKVDGIFGQQTEDLVKAYQFLVFLSQDGIVGPQTWAALDANKPVNKPILRRGSNSEDVRRVQSVLKFQGAVPVELNFKGYYFGALDGDFGSQTEAAVKAFQADTQFHSSALTADGIVGDKTWEALNQLARRILHIGL